MLIAYTRRLINFYFVYWFLGTCKNCDCFLYPTARERERETDRRPLLIKLTVAFQVRESKFRELLYKRTNIVSKIHKNRPLKKDSLPLGFTFTGLYPFES